MSGDGQQNVVSTAVLVGASDAQVAQLKKDMPNWDWVEPPADWPSRSGEPFATGPVQAIIVFAKKKREDHALEVCKKIRERREMDGVPLLVAVNMYQMGLANEGRRLPMGHFIFTPIEGQELQNRLVEMRSATGT